MLGAYERAVHCHHGAKLSIVPWRLVNDPRRCMCWLQSLPSPGRSPGSFHHTPRNLFEQQICHWGSHTKSLAPTSRALWPGRYHRPQEGNHLKVDIQIRCQATVDNISSSVSHQLRLTLATLWDLSIIGLGWSPRVTRSFFHIAGVLQFLFARLLLSSYTLLF